MQVGWWPAVRWSFRRLSPVDMDSADKSNAPSSFFLKLCGRVHELELLGVAAAGTVLENIIIIII